MGAGCNTRAMLTIANKAHKHQAHYVKLKGWGIGYVMSSWWDRNWRALEVLCEVGQARHIDYLLRVVIGLGDWAGLPRLSR
jgi:hypothetical protein